MTTQQNKETHVVDHMKDIYEHYTHYEVSYSAQHTQADECGPECVTVFNSEGKYVAAISRDIDYRVEGLVSSDTYATIEEAKAVLRAHLANALRIQALEKNQKPLPPIADGEELY